MPGIRDHNLAYHSPLEIVEDPGDGNRIKTYDRNCLIHLETGAGGETRTIGDPDFLGQWLILHMLTDGGGDCVITFDSDMNGSGHTIVTFADANRWLELFGARISGSLRWTSVRPYPSNNGPTTA